MFYQQKLNRVCVLSTNIVVVSIGILNLSIISQGLFLSARDFFFLSVITRNNILFKGKHYVHYHETRVILHARRKNCKVNLKKFLGHFLQ